MNSNNNTTRNSEERQCQVYLMQNGDWSTAPDDWGHWRPKVFFIKGGAIGIDFGGRVVVKPIEAWASCGQSSTLQRCMAWLSAVLRRMQ